MPQAGVVRSFGNAHPDHTFTVKYPDADGPVTPRIRHALQDAWSSPIGNYTINTSGTSPSSLLVHIEHPNNDRSRLEQGKRKIGDLNTELSDIRGRLEGLQAERDAARSLILQWETRDRVGQALNDYVTKKLKDSGEELIELIKGQAGRFRYLPHLFSILMLQWNDLDENQYPLMPVFSQLPHSVLNQYFSTTVPYNVNDAARRVWNSELQPFIKLMVDFYLSSPSEHNTVQHSSPTTSFAETYVRSLPHLSSRAIQVILHVIQAGTKGPGANAEPLFGHQEEAEVGNLDSLLHIESDSGLADEQMFVASMNHEEARDVDVGMADEARLAAGDLKGKRKAQDSGYQSTGEVIKPAKKGRQDYASVLMAVHN